MMMMHATSALHCQFERNPIIQDVKQRMMGIMIMIRRRKMSRMMHAPLARHEFQQMPIIQGVKQKMLMMMIRRRMRRRMMMRRKEEECDDGYDHNDRDDACMQHRHYTINLRKFV
jgi:hypothetical protein